MVFFISSCRRRSAAFPVLLCCILSNNVTVIQAQDGTSSTIPPVSKQPKNPIGGQAGNSRMNTMFPKKTRPRVALAGKIFPFLHSLTITSDQAREMWSSLSAKAELSDITTLSFLAWANVPFVEFAYNSIVKKGSNEPEATPSDTEEGATPNPTDFDQTILFQIVTHMSQACKIGLVVYIMDCLEIILTSLGVKLKFWKKDFSPIFAKMIYTIWIARRIALFKTYLMRKVIPPSRASFGKVSLYNHLLDFVIILITAVFIIDGQLGVNLSSLLAIGGVGTLIITLACKDLASQVVNGLACTASDSFYEGDKVLLGDGTSGKIFRMGWSHTIIRGSNEIMIKIPNSDIAKQRVSNISRCKKCQVKQTIRFKISDADKIPRILQEIRDEVRRRCPEVITDGSRPFRAHWRDFMQDHLSVVVDFHFNLPPHGDLYYNNRQKVLEAISFVMDKNNAEMAIPSHLAMIQDVPIPKST